MASQMTMTKKRKKTMMTQYEVNHMENLMVRNDVWDWSDDEENP